jgi:thymidylate synthase
MKQYLNLLEDVLDNGVAKSDRTGVGTIGVFGRQMRFDLSQGFPILTTKKIHWKSVVYELLWFMRGETNVKWLNDRGVKIWDEWANEDGELGPVYGSQWRSWPHYVHNPQLHDWAPFRHDIDQLQACVDKLINNPNDRRIIVSAWNVGYIEEMALPPCHLLFQFYSSCNGELSCQMYQRSCDLFLGVPFNVSSYALLVHLIAQMTGHTPGEFIWIGGDVHIYQNHMEQVFQQLRRSPTQLPHLWVTDEPRTLDNWELEDVNLIDYNPQPGIKAPIAV